MLQVNQRLLALLDETLGGSVEIYDGGKDYGNREHPNGCGEDLAMARETKSKSNQNCRKEGDNKVHADHCARYMVLESHPTCRLQVNDFVQGLQE